jgi:enterochelin esterase-like enzyme
MTETAQLKLPIETLAEKLPTEPGAVDEFLAAHLFPLAHGRTTTFVYRGEADQVNLRHGIFGLPSTQPLVRVEGTDLWFLVFELPEQSRVEYKFEVVRDGHGELVLDPLNHHLAHDPFGANSVCHGVEYEVPDWTLPDSDSRSGRLLEMIVGSSAFGQARPVRIYLPARFRPYRRYPVLIVHDGDDYMNYSSLKTVLDNLIERLEIAPMIVAMTNSPDRMVEYADDPRHATFLADELLPALEHEYPIAPGPASRGLMGASFGGVASLSAAWRNPGVFGRLLLQSGSFAFTDIGEQHPTRGPAFNNVVQFVNALRAEPGKPSDRIFMSCGTYESLIYENRSMVPVIQSTGARLRYVEASDGHNWENWRDRLREGLSWLYPGPLWMVYE